MPGLCEAALRERFERRTQLLDGATGTELTRRGVSTNLPLWSASALIDAPDVVRAIHRDYVNAGAKIIVANTFRTNPRTLRAAGWLERGEELNRKAIALAREAAVEARPVGSSVNSPSDVLIAASVAPVEDCYRPDLTPSDAELRAEHRQMAEWLVAAAPDLVWIETMGTSREALAAARAARDAGLAFVVSFVTREDGRLLGGDDFAHAVQTIDALAPLAMGVNCVPPDGLTRILPTLSGMTRRPIVAYAHIGNPAPISGWSFSQDISPERYAEHALEWRRRGANIIGGCCGTTPAHIAAAREALAREFKAETD